MENPVGLALLYAKVRTDNNTEAVREVEQKIADWRRSEFACPEKNMQFAMDNFGVKINCIWDRTTSN